MHSLQNKTALITGSSRGIGAAVAQRLAQAGAEVIIHYKHRQEEAEKVVMQIVADGGKAIAV